MSNSDRDPTYGRIDSDIQRAVDECQPASIGERVAMENTLQARRNERWHDDADGPFEPPYAAGWTTHWHLIGRHVHPEWHGHCDPTKRGYKPCDKPHWHFLWRHGHA